MHWFEEIIETIFHELLRLDYPVQNFDYELLK